MTFKKLLYIISLFLVLPMLTACSWFDVGNDSEVDEGNMFSSSEGYYSSLTGLYTNLGTKSLYGGNLPLYALEPLTQQYTVSSDNPDRIAWTQFNYTTDAGQTLNNDIFLTMFNTIVNDNMLLTKLGDKAPVGIQEKVSNIMRGEALGLRALMYFDLMRLYNPSFKVDSLAKNVPYKTDFGFSLGQRITSAQLLQNIVDDLQKARQLLSDDPLKTGQMLADKYVKYNRVQRMNYYAITALLARICLYRGDYTQAARYALEVIQSGKFRFIHANEIEKTDVYGVVQKSDRLFEPEMIFALYTENVLSVSRSYYEGLTHDFVKSTQAYADGDVRSAWFFANPSAGGKINLVRYERSTQVSESKKYGDPIVPMLKLSEMYLIAAECGLENASTGIDARAMLNELKRARGTAEVGASASAADLRREITREYICDFKGEGQLFYYYKRMNMATVDDGNYNGNTVAVPTGAYTLPLPEYEKQFGYGQNK